MTSAIVALTAISCGSRSSPDSSVTQRTGKLVDAAPTISTSGGTTAFNAQGAPVVVDPNLTLTDPDGPEIDGVRVSISGNYVFGDELSFTPGGGISGMFDAMTGILTLTGIAPASTYQSVLRTVTFWNGSGWPVLGTRQISFSIGASSLFSPENGHYYEFVEAPGITWQDARDAAASSSFYGMQGYLVTVTSAAENTFVGSKLAGQGWMGAGDPTVERTWRWLTGPEGLEDSGQGRLFFNQTSDNSQPCSGVVRGDAVGSDFHNWSSCEPNDWSFTEDYAHFYVDGSWNDYAYDSASIAGYVVEFGGMPGDATPQLAASKEVDVRAVELHRITSNAAAGGSISPLGEVQVAHGESQTYTITPATDYFVADLSIDGSWVGPATTYTFSNVTSDHSIFADFGYAAPPTVSVSAGDNQYTARNTAFPSPLTVSVVDGWMPVAGRTVVFSVPGAGASATLSAATATTDAEGLATVTATANGTAGAFTVTATVAGTSGSTTFHLTNAGEPSTITVLGGGEQSARAGQAFSTPLTAIVRDAAETPVPGATVTFAAPGSGASAVLGAASAVTNASGQVSVTATANGTVGSYTVTASVAGAGSPASFSLTNQSGTPTLGVSGGSGSYLAMSPPVVVDPTLTLAHDGGPNLTGARVTVSSGYVAGQDVLSFIASNGIAGFFDASTGVLTLSGSAPASAYQEVLRTVSYENQGGPLVSGSRTITFSLGENSLYSPETGHYYEFVSSPGIPWHTARTQAAESSYFGLQGYLATVTSAEENTFIASKLAGQGWMGASDEAVEGTWRWVTGPEGLEDGGQGRLFFNQTGNTMTSCYGGPLGDAVGGFYQNWQDCEPNDYDFSEDHAHFYVDGRWNDYPFEIGMIAGYVVEYGGMAGDPTLEVAGSKTMVVEPLPVFTITASAGANGSISPSGAVEVVQGADQTFLFSPATDYRVADVLVDGVSVGSVTSYTFTGVTAAHTIAVSFAYVVPPVITVSAGDYQYAAKSTAFPSPLTVLVQDAGGTPLAGRSVSFTRPGSGATASLSALSVTTNASGQATVTATASATAGSYTITARVVGTSAITTFHLGNFGAATAIAVVSGSGQSAIVGQAYGSPLVALVRDAANVPVSGKAVTLAAPGSGASATFASTSATTDGVGRISVLPTANTAAGAFNVTAAVAGVATPATFALTNLPGSAAVLAAISGGGQSAPVGTAFGAPLVVSVADVYGNGVPGVAVTFASPSSDASATLSAASALTNGAGLAQVSATAKTRVGSYVVTASIGVGSDLELALSNQAGSPAGIVASAGSGQSATIQTAYTTPLSVIVRDAYDNPVPGATVTFTVPASGASATLGGASAVTSSEGVATASATANDIAGAYTVTATVEGLSGPAASFALTNQNPLTLTPSVVSAAPRQPVTFVASGGSGTGYVYSIVAGPSGATMNGATGAYTAGTTPSVTDSVRVIDSEGHTATATITVGPALALTANAATVPPRGPATFTATGGTGVGLSYVVSSNASGATIDATGHYVAGVNDNVTDVVTVTDSVGSSATLSIGVGPRVTLVATATTTAPRGTLGFSASGGQGSGYVYAVTSNASGAAISADAGVYTAGPAGDVIDVVRVTDPLGNTATVNVTVGPGVTITPATPAVPPRGTVTLAGHGGSSLGYSYALTTPASGGTVDSGTGVYTAGPTPNTTDIVTVADSLGNTATVSISVGDGISVSPSSVTIAPRGTRTFVASGGSGAPYTFELGTAASGGTVAAATGVYTAGATGSVTDVLTVRDALGNTTSVDISVGPVVSLTPATATLAPLGQVQLSVAGGAGSGYTFVLAAGPSGGSVNASTGLYAAGAIGSVSDVVTVTDSLGNSASTTIQVTAALAVSASTLSVAPRATLQLTASGGATPYAFALTQVGSGGTVHATTGAYAAGATPNADDVVTVTDANGATTTISIAVGPGVSLLPATPTVAPRGPIAFGATGGSGTGYQFALTSNASGATLDAATGAYTAGATGDVADVVTVTDSLGNTASVSVSIGGRLVVNPSAPTVAPRQALSLVASGGSGTGVVFALAAGPSGATLDAATGAYRAGSTGGVTDVVTAVDSLGNTVTVPITVGPTVSISPSTATTPPRGSLTLVTAGGSGSGYQLALTTNASGGQIGADGVYTAGLIGNVTDEVTLTDDLGNTATASITVGPAITLSRSAAQVPPRGTATFAAVGGSEGGFTFVLLGNGSGGSVVSTSGVYTAGATPNTQDLVQVTDSLGNVATLSIDVGAGVSVTPAAPVVAPRGALALVAAGGSGSGYTYAFATNASGGALDAGTGAYVAGSTPDVVDVVTVTDGLGNTATVNVAVGAGLSLNPAHPTVAPRGQVTLTAAGGSGAGYQFAFVANASGGTLDGTTGAYTAGATPNVEDVVRLTDSLGNSTTVTIAVGDALRVASAASEVAPLGRVTLTVTGGSGTGLSFALSTNASGGSVSASGVYTAGATGGVVDQITVSDSVGNTATVAVRVGPVMSLSVSTGTVLPRGSVTLTVAGGAGGVTYELTTNGSGGTVDPTTGVYTAGSVGDTTDVITITDANGATVTVTIQIGPTLKIAPPVASGGSSPNTPAPVAPGSRVTLQVSGGSGSGYSWRIVSSGSGGTVDPATGAYQAGPRAGTDIIQVTDAYGNTTEIQIQVAGTRVPKAVDLRGGGVGCDVSGTGGGTPTRVGLALGLALLVVARRRRTRAPSAARPGSRSPRSALWLVLVFTVGAGLLASSTARAQSAGFALDQYTPAPSGGHWFALDALAIDGHARTAAGVASSWAYRPLVLADPAGSGVLTSVMTNQLISHAGATAVFWDRVRFGLDVPLQVLASGNSAIVDGVTYAGPANRSSLGDIRLDATLRLRHPLESYLRAAVGMTIILPTGDAASYAGDGRWGVAPRAVAAGAFRRFLYAAHAGLTLREATAFAGTSLGSELSFGVAAGIRLLRDRLFVGPELFGRTALAGSGPFEARTTPIEAILGAHYDVANEWRVGAGVAAGLTDAIGTPAVRGLITLQWVPTSSVGSLFAMARPSGHAGPAGGDAGVRAGK